MKKELNLRYTNFACKFLEIKETTKSYYTFNEFYMKLQRVLKFGLYFQSSLFSKGFGMSVYFSQAEIVKY